MDKPLVIIIQERACKYVKVTEVLTQVYIIYKYIIILYNKNSARTIGNDKKTVFLSSPFRHTSLYFLNIAMAHPFFNIYVPDELSHKRYRMTIIEITLRISCLTNH